MERPTCIPLITQDCYEGEEEYTLDFTDSNSLKRIRTTLILDFGKVLEYCKSDSSDVKEDILDEFMKDFMNMLQVYIDKYEYNILENFAENIIDTISVYFDDSLSPRIDYDDLDYDDLAEIENNVFAITIQDDDILLSARINLIGCMAAFSLVSFNIVQKESIEEIVDVATERTKEQIFTLNDYLDIPTVLFEVISDVHSLDADYISEIASTVTSIIRDCKVCSTIFTRFIGTLATFGIGDITNYMANIMSKLHNESYRDDEEEKEVPSDSNCNSVSCNHITGNLDDKEINFINSVDGIDHKDYLRGARYYSKPANCVQGQEEILSRFSVAARFIMNKKNASSSKLKVTVRVTDLMAKIFRYMYIISSYDKMYEYVNEQYDIPKYFNKRNISKLKECIKKYSNDGDMENILEYLVASTDCDECVEEEYVANPHNEYKCMNAYKYRDNFEFKRSDMNCLVFLMNSAIIEFQARICDDDGIVDDSKPVLREFWIVDRDKLAEYISAKNGCADYNEVKNIPFPEPIYTSPKSNFESIFHYYLSRVSLIGLQTMLIQNDMSIANVIWSIKHTAVLDGIRKDIKHNENLAKLFYTWYPAVFPDVEKYESKQDKDEVYSDTDKKEELIFSSESANTILDFDVEVSDGIDTYMAVCRMYDMDSEKAYRDMCKYLGIDYTFFGDGDVGDITEDMLNEKTSKIKDKVALFVYNNDGNDKKLLRKHIISKTSLRKKLKAANPLDKEELISLYKRNNSSIVTSSSVAYTLEEAFMSNDDLRDKMKAHCLKH